MGVAGGQVLKSSGVAQVPLLPCSPQCRHRFIRENVSYLSGQVELSFVLLFIA